MPKDDFNNVGPWLKKKLKERKLSVGRFTLLTGYKISSATIFRWYTDTFRPSAESMKLVCETLSKFPVIEKDGTETLKEVPWAEGLKQYTPKAQGAAAAKYGSKS